jgi:hypothetical protein
MTLSVTSSRVDGSSECGKKRRNGLGLIQDGHILEEFEFMGWVLSESEMNQRGLYVFVAGVREGGSRKSGFTDLSWPHHDDCWKLLGQFPQT